jgi:hypothetical protein
MQYTTDIELSPFTVSVGGDTFDVPTYAISNRGNEDLLSMEDGAVIETENRIIQRWHYRWFIFDDGEWFSLRLIG